MTASRGANPIGQAVRKMHPPRYTAKEAAAKIGKSEDTVIRWRREGVFKPSDSAMFGTVKVWLYTDEDLTAMSDLGRKHGQNSVTNKRTYRKK